MCWAAIVVAGGGGLLVAGALNEIERKRKEGVKPALNALTKVAAMPGSGGGCFAALPPEKNLGPRDLGEFEKRQQEGIQMKAPDFEEHDELVFPPIDLGEIGGLGA